MTAPPNPRPPAATRGACLVHAVVAAGAGGGLLLGLRLAARLVWVALFGALLALAPGLCAQDNQQQIVISGAGTQKFSLAVPDFFVPAGNAATPLQAGFNAVLWNDLTQSGRVTLVSRSFYSAPAPTTAQEMIPTAIAAWTAPPVSAQRLVSGSLTVTNGALAVRGLLFDLTQPARPLVTQTTLVDKPTAEGARLLAHQLADAVVVALGGLPFATSKIVYVNAHPEGDEVWMCDYDGHNPHSVTHFGGFILGPRLSPDGTVLSFSGQHLGETHQIHLLSLLTGRELPFPHFAGENFPPSWSPDGSRLVFASSMGGGGRSRIYVSDANGHNLKALTNDTGADDFAPVWNPKTGAQIAYCSDRSGQPRLYLMNADGSGARPLITEGYAVDPAWSPNGTSIAFAWVRHGGGEDNGAFDVYIWDLTAPPGPNQWTQMTHNELDNDSPSWGPDGARIVLQSGRTANTEIFTVLAAGEQPVALTSKGRNEQPSWSVH